MRLYGILIIAGILLGLPSARGAVTGEVHGLVTDATDGEPLAGVVIKALGRGGATLSFGSSGADGRFRLALPHGADSVAFSRLGYGTLKKGLSDDMSVIRMQTEATMLSDVIVEAPAIVARGDTLVFNTARYARPEDNAVIDVIKRLPGIKVEDDGTIKYQGRPINKFYVDGNDLVGGQYGMVTENIPHKEVKSVEVMENHQPVKALEGIEFPEEAGINIRLTDDARSRWTGVVRGGAGAAPALASGSLYLMRIGRAVQNMVTLKGDNTGWDPASENADHELDMMFSDEYSRTRYPGYITAGTVSLPLSGKRTRDNSSWLANGIAAWRRGEGSMRVGIECDGDMLDYDTRAQTDYLTPGIADLTVRERLHTRSFGVSGQFGAELNRTDCYLKNRLTVRAERKGSRSAVTGSADVAQRVENPGLTAVNDLKLVRRTEKRLFTLTSRTEFYRNPGRLRVAGTDNARQLASTTGVRTTAETQAGRMSRFLRLYVTAGIDAGYHRLHSRLEGAAAYDNAGIYETFLSEFYLRPGIEYERSGWLVNLNLPVRWIHRSGSGSLDRLTGMPGLYVKRHLSAKSDLSVSASGGTQAPAPQLDIPAAVMTDFHDIFAGRTDGKCPRIMSASARYRYRNPFKALFLNASASVSLIRRTMTVNRIFDGEMMVTTYDAYVSRGRRSELSAGVSKGLGHSRMVIGTEITASRSHLTALHQGVAASQRETGVTVAPYLRGSITRQLSAGYNATFTLARQRVGRSENGTYGMLSQHLTATVSPGGNVTVTAGAEHFMTRFTSGGRSGIMLLDLTATWAASRRVRLSLAGQNLLDRRDYSYMSYGIMSRSEYHVRLRGRNLLATVQYRL